MASWDWSSVAGKIKDVAPDVAPDLLGDLVTGDYVGMARTAVSAFVGASEPTPDAVAEAMDRNPEAAAKLAQLRIDKYKAETERQQAFYAEQDSARQMHIAAMENGDNFQDKLASGVLVGGCVLMVGLVFFPDLTLSENLRVFVLGFLTSEMGKVLSHYFGNRRGTRDSATPADLSARDAGGFMSHVKTRGRK